MTALRVLVVDDAALYRKIISDALTSLPDVEVVGTAGNGSIALARITALRPDLVLLDIEMPEMNGFEVLQGIRSLGLDVGVVMVSAFTRRGSEMTIRALEMGAFDFITKATEGSPDQNREAIRTGLAAILRAFARKHEIRQILQGNAPPSASGLHDRKPVQAGGDRVVERMDRLAGKSRAEMILIGISTGGPNALSLMLPRLPGNLDVPVFIVQHMPPLFTRSLAESLNERCALKVKEAQDREIAHANTIYIAPGGKQMKLDCGPTGEIVIKITEDPPENNCKPSVDTLFRSAANHFPGKSSAVIMTGMGSDGTLGLRLLKRHGCRVIAQDEASCVVYGMPKEAVDAGVVDLIVPLEGIAAEIVRAVKGFSSL